MPKSTAMQLSATSYGFRSPALENMLLEVAILLLPKPSTVMRLLAVALQQPSGWKAALCIALGNAKNIKQKWLMRGEGASLCRCIRNED